MATNQLLRLDVGYMFCPIVIIIMVKTFVLRVIFSVTSCNSTAVE